MHRPKWRGGGGRGVGGHGSSGIHLRFMTICLGFAFLASTLAFTTLDTNAAERNVASLYSNSIRRGHKETPWNERKLNSKKEKKCSLSSVPVASKLPLESVRGGGRTRTRKLKTGTIILPTSSFPHIKNESPSTTIGIRRNLVSKGPDNNVEFNEALKRTAILLVATVAFGVGTGATLGRKSMFEFFASYLVEQSLGVDNLIVFILLFNYFKVPSELQPRVLKWGLVGAATMRAVMVLAGVTAMRQFRGVVLLFSGILIFCSLKLLSGKEVQEADLENNFIIRICRHFFKSTSEFDEDKFITVENGVKKATPLLFCLVCIELSDFVFAADSIPAVLGVSKDPFIVYSSNVFAIMSLWSLYTLIRHELSAMPYLKPAIALVLGFVGAKMAMEYFHIEICGVGASLSIVASILVTGVVASIIKRKTIKCIDDQ